MSENTRRTGAFTRERRFGALRGLCVVWLFALLGALGWACDPPDMATEYGGEQPPARTGDVHVSEIRLGTDLDGDKRVTDQTSTFKPSDPIFVSVTMEGVAGRTDLKARWFRGDKLLKITAYEGSSPGETTAEMHLVSRDHVERLEPGDYSVEILFNGKPLKRLEFQVAPENDE